MRQELLSAIQNIERLSQMQFCGEGYLDEGHSIYAAYDLSELGDIMFRGIYTAYHELPDYLEALNGCQLNDVAKALVNNNVISKGEYDLVIKGWYAD